jgi:hypothetical protein
LDRFARASIVVPVCNEAPLLPQTVPRLLASASELGATIVWVCNGCTDDSLSILRCLTAEDQNVCVIELAIQSKTLAMQAGDEVMGQLFPRFYIDADVHLQPGDLERLFAVLDSNSADLVGPGIDFDCSRATRVSASIARCWLALPQAKEMAILGVIGVSQAGRACWKDWPDILGDDIFVRAVVPLTRSCRVSKTKATSPAPKNFFAWIRTRKRWLAGERQLRIMGLNNPQHPDQRTALLVRLRKGPDRLGALAFFSARMLAGMSRFARGDTNWTPDRKR